MALDRQSIKKQDFPTTRQGYDKAAVDAHLAAIADEFEHLTLASSASERVRAIVAAAETSAAQIQREADDAAQATRQEAEQAARHAREGAGKLSELAAALSQRLDESRRELEALVGSLPGAARSSGAEPQLRTEARVHPDPADTEPETAAVEPAPAPTPQIATPPAPEHAPALQQPPAPEHPPAVETAAAVPAGTADENEAARLIALNMALDGSSRDETAKYLDENFQLADRDRLLDEVYASVDG
ncbi:MAG: DivIVA domain-containing protein [Solirubrobacteraceae bacterium]